MSHRAVAKPDVNGTITQLILQWLSGEQAFGTDVVPASTQSKMRP